MTQASRSLSFGGTSRIGLLLAGALAVVAGVLVFVAINQSDSGSTSTTNVTGGSETVVVTAKQDIDARTQITADMLQLTRVPSNALLPGALNATDLVVGRVARIPVYKGEQLLQEKLASTKTDLGLSYIVPDGMRAMAVKADKVIGAGGLIRPGDRVDVVAVVDVKYTDIASNQSVTDTRAFTIAQNVEVLAVEQKLENQIPQNTNASTTNGASATPGANQTNAPVDQPAAQPDGTVVTLALTPDDAQKVLLSQEKGTIRLSVRAPGDDSVANTTDTSYLSLADPAYQQALIQALKDARK